MVYARLRTGRLIKTAQNIIVTQLPSTNVTGEVRCLASTEVPVVKPTSIGLLGCVQSHWLATCKTNEILVSLCVFQVFRLAQFI